MKYKLIPVLLATFFIVTCCNEENRDIEPTLPEEEQVEPIDPDVTDPTEPKDTIPTPDIVPDTICFTYHTHNATNIELPYREAIIAPSQGGRAALVLYLHGGTSKGSDNEAPIYEKGVDSIANHLLNHGRHAIFIVPQCPSNLSWGGPMNAALKSLIDLYLTDTIVDSNTIYILGGSMGGTGTWGMVSAYPNFFTAAMPVAGNPSRSDVNNVTPTPILTVMGTADAIMSVETVSNFIEIGRASCRERVSAPV